MSFLRRAFKLLKIAMNCFIQSFLTCPSIKFISKLTLILSTKILKKYNSKTLKCYMPIHRLNNVKAKKSFYKSKFLTHINIWFRLIKFHSAE